MRPRTGGPLSSLRGNRTFRYLWLSNLFFFGGVWTQTLVMGWLAFHLTGSDLLVAVFTAVRLAPLLLGPMSGAIADRHNRVLLLTLACGWAATVAALVAALGSFGALSYGVLVVGGLAIGIAQSPSQPARASLVFDLVGQESISNANALNALALNMTQVFGPALGGVMIAAIGAPAALWVSAGWYAISLLLLIPLRGAGTVAAPAVEHESVVTSVVGGLRTIGRNRLAVAILLVTVSANLMLWPIFQTFMPVFADEAFGLGPAGLGSLLTCSGIGGLIGSLIIAALGDFRAKGAFFVVGTGLWAVGWALFAWAHSPALGFVLMAWIGMTSAAFAVLQTTLLLITTDRSVHGRVLGLQELAIGVMPVSTLALGAIAERVGVGLTTFGAACGLLLALALIGVRVPSMLHIR